MEILCLLLITIHLGRVVGRSFLGEGEEFRSTDLVQANFSGELLWCENLCCKAGYYPLPCSKDEPRSKCAQCPSRSYQPNTTCISMGHHGRCTAYSRCSPKQGFIVVNTEGLGNFTVDARCGCDMLDDYYDPDFDPHNSLTSATACRKCTGANRYVDKETRKCEECDGTVSKDERDPSNMYKICEKRTPKLKDATFGMAIPSINTTHYPGPGHPGTAVIKDDELNHDGNTMKAATLPMVLGPVIAIVLLLIGAMAVLLICCRKRSGTWLCRTVSVSSGSSTSGDSRKELVSPTAPSLISLEYEKQDLLGHPRPELVVLARRIDPDYDVAGSTMTDLDLIASDEKKDLLGHPRPELVVLARRIDPDYDVVGSTMTDLDLIASDETSSRNNSEPLSQPYCEYYHNSTESEAAPNNRQFLKTQSAPQNQTPRITTDPQAPTQTVNGTVNGNVHFGGNVTYNVQCPHSTPPAVNMCTFPNNIINVDPEDSLSTQYLVTDSSMHADGQPSDQLTLPKTL